MRLSHTKWNMATALEPECVTVSVPIPMRTATGWWACSALATLLLPLSVQLPALANAAGASSGKIRYTNNAPNGGGVRVCDEGSHHCHSDGAPRPHFTASTLIEIRASEMDQTVRAKEI